MDYFGDHHFNMKIFSKFFYKLSLPYTILKLLTIPSAYVNTADISLDKSALYHNCMHNSFSNIDFFMWDETFWNALISILLFLEICSSKAVVAIRLNHPRWLRLLFVLTRWSILVELLFNGPPIVCGGSVLSPCFVIHYLMSFPVLQSS